MTDPFQSWIKFQEQMLEVQKAQLEITKRALKAGHNMADAQKAAQEAARTNIRAWQSWLSLWGGGK